MFQPKFENDKSSNEDEINNPLTITSLPPELIELVSVSLDMNSFLLMRFICRLFCSSLERELLRRIESSKPKQIAFGGGYFIVLHEDGTVSECKIDIDDPKSISTCNRKRLPNLPEIVQVAANGQNSFYLDINGNVWYENNSNRNLQIETSFPKLISNVSNVIQLAVRERSSTLFLKSDGTVLAHIDVNHGNLSGLSEELKAFESTPLEDLEAISGDICQIELFSNRSFFLKKDGTVWIRKEYNSSRATVIQIPELTDIVRMFIGYYNYYFIKEDRSIWGYGSNLYGSLGVDAYIPIFTPTPLSNLTYIHQVYSYRGYTLFITEEGSLLYSGRIKALKQLNSPTLISGLAGVKQVLNVPAGRKDLILLLMDDGRILSVDSEEKLFEFHDSSNISNKIPYLNKWSKIHKQFSSKSRFFHQSNSHETLETQKKAKNLTKQALERAPLLKKELKPKPYKKKSRCSIM